MNICIVHGSFYKDSMGGSELQLALIGKELAELGNKIYFIALESSKWTYKETCDGITVYRIHKKKGLIYILTFRFLFYKFWNLFTHLRKIRPDIILMRSPRDLFLCFITSKLLGYRLPIVYSIASDLRCVPIGRAKELGYFRKINVLLLKQFLANRIIHRIEKVVAQTNNQASLLSRYFGIDAVIIPNGHPVPCPPFKKAKCLMVLRIANIKPLKRVGLFLKLSNKFKNLGIKFILVGRKADEKYQEFLNKMITKASNVKFLGELSLDQVDKLLSISSVLIDTSLPIEGFPNTYIQAWMRETPVVTLDFDPDGIIKKHGFGFHSKSFDQMIRDVEYLIKNEEIRRQMGARARQYSLQNHNIKNIAQRYLELFKTVLDQSR
jgi:glycosyltransferase involved in cell wall biosynthesis